MAQAATLTAGALPQPAAADADRIDPRRLLTFFFMVFGMFMAILDIQIVSASLTEIQAGLSASSNEIAWVQTAYLIAEVVMIPLSGFLSRALGTRYLFTISAAGFTAASLMCGLSSDINEMIFWRAVQGFIGGGMIPTVFATAFTIFPRSKLGIISPIIGLVATLAPTIGPTVGGYLTDAMSWHWLFFINVVPGICVTIATLALIDFDRPNLGMFRHFDWIGLITMAGFLGALEYVLEDGPRYDWFNDDSILACAWISALSAAAFFARVLAAEHPIVDIRSYANRNFALVIGETMFVSGLAMLLTAPLAGRLVAKVDQRLMLMFGFFCFAIGTWWMTYLTKDWDFQELLWPQVFRGVGLMFAIIPINNIALGTLPPDRVKNASGLYNLMRNLGGAVGLAAIYTFLNDRTDLHLARLHEALNSAYRPALEALDGLTSRFQAYGSDARIMALKQLFMMTHREGLVMAFGDVFLALTVLFAVMGLSTMLMKRPSVGAAPASEH